jgi:hypothetical protein
LRSQAINCSCKYYLFCLVLLTDSSVLLIKYCSGDQIEKIEMGEACSTYGGEERCIQGCGVGKPELQNHLKYPGIDGRIILRWIFRKWHGGGKDWIELAQDRDMWRTLVNAVMNFRVP